MTLEEHLIERGYTVDHGDLIGGPFIPDGTVRIYRDGNPSDLAGEGRTLKEAARNILPEHTDFP